MRPSTIWYTLKQGIKNIKRNFMFSIASIITMAACIFLFGIFFSIVNNVNTLAHKVEEDVPITVLFNEGTTQEQMDAVGELIRQRPEVSKIEFESGDEAWEKMKQEYFGDDSEAADGFKDDNPLANSSNYRVYMNNIEKQSELVAYIKTLDNVREVNQSEQAAKTPKMLLCDEPTGALDYQTGKAILKLLQDMCRQKGMTVVVITHNSALTPMADRVIKIKNGKVAQMTLNAHPTPVEEIEW